MLPLGTLIHTNTTPDLKQTKNHLGGLFRQILRGKNMRGNSVTLLTTEQVSKILNVNEITLAEWRRNRTGPDFIVLKSNTVKYNLDSIMEYLRENALFEIPQDGSYGAGKRPH